MALTPEDIAKVYGDFRKRPNQRNPLVETLLKNAEVRNAQNAVISDTLATGVGASTMGSDGTVKHCPAPFWPRHPVLSLCSTEGPLRKRDMNAAAARGELGDRAFGPNAQALVDEAVAVVYGGFVAPENTTVLRVEPERAGTFEGVPMFYDPLPVASPINAGQTLYDGPFPVTEEMLFAGSDELMKESVSLNETAKAVYRAMVSADPYMRDHVKHIPSGSSMINDLCDQVTALKIDRDAALARALAAEQRLAERDRPLLLATRNPPR